MEIKILSSEILNRFIWFMFFIPFSCSFIHWSTRQYIQYWISTISSQNIKFHQNLFESSGYIIGFWHVISYHGNRTFWSTCSFNMVYRQHIFEDSTHLVSLNIYKTNLMYNNHYKRFFEYKMPCTLIFATFISWIIE